MKLVELLVKELEEWPQGVTYFVQDRDGEVKAAGESEPREPREPLYSGVWIRYITLNNYNFYSCLCTDWKTSIVTKDIYTKHKEETQMKLDFRNTKIRIKSEEHSKVFQEAVFAAGGEWQHSGEFYRRGVNFIFLNDSLGMTLCDNAVFFQEHDYKEIYLTLIPAKGHVHAELMAQYAEDAKSQAEPWKMWQSKGDDGVWRYCCAHPMWASDTEYRHKPKTKLIHGVEIPVFDFTPKVGEKYYTANVNLIELYGCGHKPSDNCTFTERMSERGLIYPCTEEGKQSAILHSKAMLGIA